REASVWPPQRSPPWPHGERASSRSRSPSGWPRSGCCVSCRARRATTLHRLRAESANARFGHWPTAASAGYHGRRHPPQPIGAHRMQRIRTLLAVLAGAVLVVAPSAQAASPDLVIAQVYGGGGNSGATYQNDYVELCNRGGSPVDLTGWTVQYASASSTSWSATA